MKSISLNLLGQGGDLERRHLLDARILDDWKITIVPAGSDASLSQAGILFSALETKLTELKCRGASDVPGGYGTTKELLVLVSDGSAFQEVPRLQPDVVLPLVQQGSNVNLPDHYVKYNAYFWRLSIQEAITLIIGKIGFYEEDVKLFISYRRLDTQPLAEQLYRRLTEEGFDVFLDRFSIDPTTDFQNRLYQELADKAMVVILESPTYQQSKWVQYELDFIRINRLGYLALNIDGASPCAAIDDDHRENLRSGADLDIEGKLHDSALETVVNRIWNAHAQTLYLMKMYLRQSVLRQMPGATEDNTSYISVGAGDESYTIWPFVRPPRVNDYHFVECKSPSKRNIIVGPTFMEEGRKTLNAWISGKVSIKFFEESRIMDIQSSEK